MNEETAAALNAINRRFYEQRADEFNQTRERPWQGWDDLYERIGERLPPSPRILDLGCGNGRFARFVRERREGPLRYTGIDASALGLDHARRRIGALAGVRLLQHDLLAGMQALPEALAGERFDWIVLFGVMHHVPGRERRRRLVAAASERLAPGAFLVYAVWRFDRFERFRRKLVPWEDYLDRSGVSLDVSQLEPGDAIMTWGDEAPAYRYCHQMSDEEADALSTGLSGITEVDRFDGDGDKNTYFLLQRDGSVPNDGAASC